MLFRSTITDANSCTTTASVVITQPTVLTATVSTTSVTCNGGTNGTASVSVSGGTSSYSYVWSNNSTSQSLSGLSAGTYSVTVTDANGCVATAQDVVTEASPIVLNTLVSSITCNGAADGFVDLTVSGGTTPYTYAWSNGKTFEDISNLSPGQYSVIVTDANGCSATTTVTITQPAALTATTSVNNVLCNNASTGSISLTVSGGTPTYSYAWSNSATTQNLNNLVAGTYTVLITDANSCTTTASATITQPTAITIVTTATAVS